MNEKELELEKIQFEFEELERWEHLVNNDYDGRRKKWKERIRESRRTLLKREKELLMELGFEDRIFSNVENKLDEMEV
ncbi:hypothetical protein AKJ51_04175 [candidate division MSBL1 archaeon SCGC-AAA382A20]|uniref:Uncharacterized protein n=1 Tax=candidate division MSBL1 archaeon SCGC-AAA382A20 TaxID=1698280 RepID=A0A133VI44_9EURY|nr:hypothetical protein AKJ51_04175 [candidate division MSBL1 archaeon SCGC-AAA382A20]